MVIKLLWFVVCPVNNEYINFMVVHVMIVAIWWMMMVMMKIVGTDYSFNGYF